MQLFDLAKAELIRSNADRRHPFRFFWLGTTGVFPEVRTVVKRKTEADLSVIFFTDARSPKMEQMQKDPRVSALFYHPKKMLQVRIRGTAEFILPGHAEFEDFFQQVKNSKMEKDYQSVLPPGSILPEEELPGKTRSALHFAALRIRPKDIDILQVGREEHVRCLYFQEANEWKEQRLVP
jgi:pyridoxamine 5'-phosphate oxidase